MWGRLKGPVEWIGCDDKEDGIDDRRAHPSLRSRRLATI